MSICLIRERYALIMFPTSYNLSIKIMSSNFKTIKSGESICKMDSRYRLRSAQISHSQRKMAAPQSRWLVESGHLSTPRPCSSNLTTVNDLSQTLGIISRIHIWRTHSPAIYLNWVSFQPVQRKLLTQTATKLWSAMFKTTLRTARGPVNLWIISRRLASLGNRSSTIMSRLLSLSRKARRNSSSIKSCSTMLQQA